MDRISDNFEIVSLDKISATLVSSLNLYAKLFYKQLYKLVRLPNNKLGICVRLSTNAGSDSLLVQHEPVIIEISNDKIELCELKVYPDRIGFPFERFPHVNYPVGNMPPSLCLTREDFQNWYAEHNFAEYIDLIGTWFEDANKGNLIKIKDKDYFEPFRTHDIKCIMLRVPYEDKYLENAVNPITISFNIENWKDNLFYCNILHPSKKAKEIGVLLNRPAKDICSSWFLKYPQNLGELYNFIAEERFNLDKTKIDELINRDNLECENIFFSLAFPRPTTVLNKSTCIDYLTFKIKLEDYTSNNLEGNVDEVMVEDIANIDIAKYISGTPNEIGDKKILILGCGAIGSKVIYHLYRSGICNLTICDKDVMQSHNVCRHALSKFNLLSPKVKLIKEELDQMFINNPKPIKTVEYDLLEWLPKTDLNDYDIIIDTTASASVFRCLDNLSHDISSPIIHFALSDAGNIGLVYIKFNNLSKLSDYYMQLARLAIDNEDLSNWLHKEKRYNYDWVRIGEGCHSNTMILSDDVISSHASIASSIIRNIFSSEKENTAYLSFANVEYIGQMFSDNFKIPEFVDIQCDNNQDWHVRIPKDLLSHIRLQAKISGKKEIGGYMMGNVDVKYKTIYVLHQYKPNDSKQKTSRLSLGIQGWKEEYNKVKSSTASMLDYIGDWHSHPIGSLNMSTRDILTNYAIKTSEIVSEYGLCLITNSSNTKAHLLEPGIEVYLV